ncbi:AlwI family type II restriction endonuclease [Ruminococcus albus]|uniref:Restriction endonuclease, type II, AlwI n=1 Tax=Ruminococcus albus (strain ATCC 27210 / DSM 20455 / JCM 14654 / NCDO 2250 / 7) TaxID=697329 RepID=E6UJ45_RUMA7|nr:AlwI family type II restriction endonuclease [Ruminococcus albus]ADU23393.1 Restriction endonuclease, type II, AlwI [Ruminococcus albus 7 = DSM 20455]MBP7223401.1 AlwI family type II restriction endonuclease [Sedimentibacter sp.]
MARLQGRTLFFITSPRSPFKMIPEISLLVKDFTGKEWNTTTQEEFIKELVQDEHFEGTGSPKDLAFSARDRINRGPKALGFVDLKPSIQLTDAGKNFIDEDLCEEALLRQLLKFQLPSPYHTETTNPDVTFCVKPYLEILRLVYTLEKVTFDEIMIFGMQLTSYTKFDEVVQKILKFRKAKENNRGSYKNFMGKYRDDEIFSIFSDDIQQGNTKTRESKDASVAKFIKTKASNQRDYTDACFRYLRATGLVSISQKGKSLYITPEKKAEVEYYLNNIDRKPVFIDSEREYKAYLFDSTVPTLYTDDRDNIIQELSVISPGISYADWDIFALKKELKHKLTERKAGIISKQVKRLKDYKEYADVIGTFGDIMNKAYYDTPLMFEWNTWRAMTMLDGGNIVANLKFDDNGDPLSTASGNMADIVCDYGKFALAVEVTMQSGQKQYEMEGEPVSRHLAKLKKETGKEAYCFFIAPKINESCIAHFFVLHKLNLSSYGGESVIIPLELDVFTKMVEQSGKATYEPSPEQVHKFCKYSMEVAKSVNNEMEWYEKIRSKALDWLAA